MLTTGFFDDFIAYYGKALVLQEKNLNLVPETFRADDPLMDNITIYDTVNRRFAGFSKALEDIHGVRSRKDLVRYEDFSKRLTIHQFHFLHLFHRFTGSGASFQPTILPDGNRNPKEHGYCNNHVQKLALALESEGIEAAQKYIVECKEPMVTSVGNQPPSLKNGDPSKYRLAQQYYFDNFARDFINAYLLFLYSKKVVTGPTGIKEAVDFCLNWHSEHNFKRWHFIMTAFVMDTAEYYPDLVDPTSHCYYGANCIKSFNLMFERVHGKGSNHFENCMTAICREVNGRPYDVEDVCCDYIRYVVEYVPKGYEHLDRTQTVNNCTLKENGEYPEWAKLRMERILK